jgi:hypothetical protein
MSRLYSYVVRFDDGAAPNPFWGTCTLTICKPAIRRVAQPGHWIVGIGSKSVRLQDGSFADFAGSVVYAMKVTAKMTLEEYDDHCRQFLVGKIPFWESPDWRLRLGDCVYDYSNGGEPLMRDAVHDESARTKDLNGKNALLSTHFYYFGLAAQPLPPTLKPIVWQGRNHRVVDDVAMIERFEQWISTFELNRIYADPQLRYWYDDMEEEIRALCSTHDDDDASEPGNEPKC